MVGFAIGKPLNETIIIPHDKFKVKRVFTQGGKVVGNGSRVMERIMEDSDMEQKTKNPLEDSLLMEAERFLNRLRRCPYNRKSKVFSIDELHIDKLVSDLCEWNGIVTSPLICRWDRLSEIRDVLTNILSERRKKRIKMEEDVIDLFKTSVKRCTEILAAKDAEEDKKEPWEEGERRVEDLHNPVGGGMLVRKGMNYEEVHAKLSHLNGQKQILLDGLHELHAIMNTIIEETPTLDIVSELDDRWKSVVDNYQYFKSSLDVLSEHYNDMIKQWAS